MDLTEILLLAFSIALGMVVVLLALVALAMPAVRGPEDTFFLAFSKAINALFVRCVHGFRPSGGDFLPPSGPAIVVANHQSGIDPAIVAAGTRRWIRFLMAREYYETRGLEWLFRKIEAVPVRRNGNDLGATRKALKLLRDGRVVGIFPQGGIREADDSLDAGKAGAALLALRTGAPVVPLYIEGTPATDSVLAGILLPSRARLHVGSPIHFPRTGEKPSRQEIQEAGERILDALKALKEEVRGAGHATSDVGAAP